MADSNTPPYGPQIPDDSGGFDLGSLLKILTPILATVAAKKLTPDPAKQTADQNATTLNNLPPQFAELLKTQLDRVKLTDPLYKNAVTAQNRLLPAWARTNAVGGATGVNDQAPVATGGALGAPYTGAIDTTPDIPTTPPNNGGRYGSSIGGDGNKNPPAGGSDNPFFGVSGAEGTGNSGLSPAMILQLLGLLSGMSPVTGALARAVKPTSVGAPVGFLQ